MKKRLLGLILFFIAGFALLIYQFYVLQIKEGAKWQRIASGQHYFTIQEPFQRGAFFTTSARNTHIDPPRQLVFDVPAFHLHVDCTAIPPKLHDILSESIQQRIKLKAGPAFIRGELQKQSKSRRLAAFLTPEQKEELSHFWIPFAKKEKLPKNALFFVPDTKRAYPYGKMLGQVLHTIQYQKDTRTHNAIPTGGLELHFDSYLQGKVGQRRLMRSPRNAFETGIILSEPVDGADIYLTIDHTIQAIAEEELAKGVIKTKAKSGWAVLMDHNTGYIWALAQYPYFDPSRYPEFFSDPAKRGDTRVKAIQDAHEIGSIMKPLTLSIALKANNVLQSKNESLLFSPTDKASCSDSKFPGRKKPLKDTHFHAYLNMDMALQKSSNIYVARLMEKVIARLGATWYQTQFHELFGLGKKTGIELPSESHGLVPTPGKKHPNGKLEWSQATPYSLAMGHNIMATGLQMVQSFAVLANGGHLVKPTLIYKINSSRASGSQTLIDNTKRKKSDFPQVLEEEIVNRVVRAMRFTTKQGGTAKSADVPGFTEAGKTATATKIVGGKYCDKLYCSSFIGFTPAESPAFVLLVSLDEPSYGYIPGLGLNHHGGTAAGPIFREIATRTLAYLGKKPDDPYGYPYGDPRRDITKAVWIEETDELKKLYELWNGTK